MIAIGLFFVLTTAYVILFACYLFGWVRTRSALPDPAFIPSLSVSVVIAARNEEAVVATCIESLLRVRYPQQLLEIIIVDDDSADATGAIVQQYADKGVRCINLRLAERGPGLAYKKRALAAGIEAASGELIVTTDADCFFHPEWLRCISYSYSSEDAKMIIAPVRFENNGSICDRFQEFDFMTMQGITAATRYWNSGVMCNGANLAFSKAAYQAVGGYEGVDHIISGDDYLLMMKIERQFPEGIHYLKLPEAAVYTLPQPGWYALFQQRLRWASKSGKYSDPVMTVVLTLVFCFNVALLLAGVYACFNTLWTKILLYAFVSKIIIEMLFLYAVHRVLPLKRNLWFFPLLQPLHIIYITLIGGLSRFGRFEWKGRKAIQS